MDFDRQEKFVDIAGSVALVTGANRGLGAAFCRALLDQGASKVYAGARDPESIKVAGVTPVRLDITSPADVAAAAALCSDTTVLVNPGWAAEMDGHGFLHLVNADLEDQA